MKRTFSALAILFSLAAVLIAAPADSGDWKGDLTGVWQGP